MERPVLSKVEPGSMFRPELHQGLRCVFVGPGGSGKTHAMCRAIRAGWFNYADRPYDEMVLMSPSNSQPDYRLVPWTKVIPRYDEQELAAVVYRQELRDRYLPRDKQKRVLLVIDDAAGEEGLKKVNSPITLFFIRGRHLLINVVVLLQKLNLISATARNCASIVAFKTRNALEQRAIYDAGGLGTPGEFKALLELAWSKQYRPFIYIQPTDSFYIGFAQQLAYRRPGAAEAAKDAESDEKKDASPAQSAAQSAAPTAVEPPPTTAQQQPAAARPKAIQAEAAAETQSQAAATSENVAEMSPEDAGWWASVFE